MTSILFEHMHAAEGYQCYQSILVSGTVDGKDWVHDKIETLRQSVERANRTADNYKHLPEYRDAIVTHVERLANGSIRLIL